MSRRREARRRAVLEVLREQALAAGPSLRAESDLCDREERRHGLLAVWGAGSFLGAIVSVVAGGLAGLVSLTAGWVLVVLSAVLLGITLCCLAGGIIAARDAEQHGPARRLSRHWPDRPAAYLTCEEFAVAGLHAAVADALDGVAHARAAGALAAGGFPGSLGELVAASRAVLAPAG